MIPATGGKPRQLTFHTADDTVVGWTPDGKKIIFTSVRGKGVFPRVATLWEIAVEGGIERPVQTDWGAWASYSPDGTKMAFTRHPATWSRKHYRGSYAADLWVMDVAAKKFTKLGDPDYHGNCCGPCMPATARSTSSPTNSPNEKGIKFGGPDVMKSVNNIWKISDKGGKPVQVTNHGDGNLFFPSISADGKTIVYEDNFGIWKLDTASGKSSEIAIDIKTDAKENDTELVTLSDAEGFNLSPSNKRAAVAAARRDLHHRHGSRRTAARHRDAVARAGSALVAEREMDRFRCGSHRPRGGLHLRRAGQEAKKMSDADCDKTGDHVGAGFEDPALVRVDHKLRMVEVETGKRKWWRTSDAGNVPPAVFAGWQVDLVSQQDKQLRSHVWLKELATGQEHMIGGDEFLISSGARWTPDGKKLLLIGGTGAPAMAALNRTVTQLYAVALQPTEKAPDTITTSTPKRRRWQPAGDASGRGGRGGERPRRCR